MNKGRFKFNGGDGAILCTRCNVVVKTPAKEEDLETTPDLCEFCKNIKPKMD